MSVGVSAASATAAAAAADAAVAKPGEEGAGETGTGTRRAGIGTDVASGVASSGAEPRREFALAAKSPLAHRASGDARDVRGCAGVVIGSFGSPLVPVVEGKKTPAAAAAT